MNLNDEHFHIDDLPDFKALKLEFNDSDFTLWDYVNYKSDWDLAVGFSKIFFPDFVDLNGYVFLAEKNDPILIDEWKKKLNENQKNIELMINHTHIYDLFGGKQSRQPNANIVKYIGEILSMFWDMALKLKFPDRKFKIYLSNESDDYGPTITFCQMKDIETENHQLVFRS